MYCNKCGASIPDGMKFCHKCGAALPRLDYAREEPAPAPSAATPEPVSAPAAPAPTPKERMESAVARRQKKKGRVSRPWLIASVAAVVCVIVFFTIYYGTGAVVKNKAGSVYYLEVYDARGNCFATGSGFVINDGFHLVTNFHVIEDAAKVNAFSADGTDAVELTRVRAFDRNSDLIILRSDRLFAAKPLRLADSDNVRQGDRVYAIGYPLALSNTLSDGIVSARYVDGGLDIIQTTAAISGGSSGGALLNTRGRVIGVTEASYVYGQNMNIAIASNELEELLKRPIYNMPLLQVSG